MKRRAYKEVIAEHFLPQIFRARPSSTDMLEAHPNLRSEEELSALPIWAFTLGVFALLTFGLTAVPSIICGHLALARERTGRSFAKSVALTGLVIGYAGVALFGTWLVVMARHFTP
jgi:hypothetical protein